MPVNDIEALEPEIDLKDLFFHLLYHWRSILLVALVCMVGLAFWQNHKIDSVHAEGEKTEEEEAWELEVKAYYNAIEHDNSKIATRTSQITTAQEYLQDSLWINIDSDNEWVGSRTWFIQSTPEALAMVPEGGQTDPADFALNTYVSVATSNLDPAELEALFGTSRLDYIWEICSVSARTENNTLTISARGNSAEQVNKILDYFQNRVDTLAEPQAQLISGHTRQLVSEDIKQDQTNKNSRNDAIKSRQENIKTWQDEIAAAQADLNKLLREEEPAAPGKHVLRYAVIGLLLGGIVMVVLYAAAYLLGGRVHSGEDIAILLQTGTYGALAHTRARRPGKGIDGLIEKWEFKHTERDAAKVYDSTGALIRQSVPAGTLLLTGTPGAEKLGQVEKELARRLPELRITSAPDFLHRASAVEEASRADAVLLVEEKEVSRMAEITRIGEMLTISGVQVKGCFML